MISYIANFNLKKLLDLKNDDINTLLFEMYIHDHEKMRIIVPELNYEQLTIWKYLYVKDLLINKNIVKHKKNIYDRPGNIFCMCFETLFYIKQKNQKLMTKIPNKLKFLFDIKNINDLQKIYYYLHN